MKNIRIIKKTNNKVQKINPCGPSITIASKKEVQKVIKRNQDLCC